MPNPTFHLVNETSDGNLASISLTSGGSPMVGDIALAVFGHMVNAGEDSGLSGSPPANWNLLENVSATDPNYKVQWWAYWAIGANVDAPITSTWNFVTAGAVLGLLASWSSVNPSSTPGSDIRSNGNSSSVTSPSYLPTHGDGVLAFFGLMSKTGFGPVNGTAPNDMTERSDTSVDKSSSTSKLGLFLCDALIGGVTPPIDRIITPNSTVLNWGLMIDIGHFPANRIRMIV